MLIKELIKKLREYNPNAETKVIVHNHSEEYSIVWGTSDGEGTPKKDCKEVSFYVDRLCQGEEK